jgi:hypothetical protein
MVGPWETALPPFTPSCHGGLPGRVMAQGFMGIAGLAAGYLCYVRISLSFPPPSLCHSRIFLSFLYFSALPVFFCLSRIFSVIPAQAGIHLGI